MYWLSGCIARSFQLLSCVQVFATPWTAEHQAYLSITNSQSLLKLMSIESVMSSNHLILCHPLLLLSSIFPCIRVFSNEPVIHISSVQFSHSVMSASLWPHGLHHTRLPCPWPTPGSYPNSCQLSQWCHPPISSSVIPFSSHLQSFPASGSFPMSRFFASGGQSIGVSASVLLMCNQDWFPLGWTGWISLLSKGVSRVFSNIRVQNHQFCAQPPLWSNSHIHTWPLEKP